MYLSSFSIYTVHWIGLCMVRGPPYTPTFLILEFLFNQKKVIFLNSNVFIKKRANKLWYTQYRKWMNYRRVGIPQNWRKWLYLSELQLHIIRQGHLGFKLLIVNHFCSWMVGLPVFILFCILFFSTLFIRKNQLKISSLWKQLFEVVDY